MLEPTVIQFQAPTDAAYAFGMEDAETGDNARPEAFYAPGTPQWTAYCSGYVDGYRGNPDDVLWMLDPMIGEASGL